MTCGISKTSCCGCNKHTTYKKYIKKYEDLGILEYVMELKRKWSLKKTLSEIQHAIEVINEKLSDQLKDL